jgi:hypothetical protein
VSADAEAALTAVDEILARGGDADDLLRAVLDALQEHGIHSAAVRFVENGELVDGPVVGAGERDVATAVVYEGAKIGELEVSGGNQALADAVAGRIAPYVLVGWDTSGEPWDA